MKPMRFVPYVLAVLPVGLSLVACDPSAPVVANDGGIVDTCPVPTGAGTVHTGSITKDETWAAADSPHIVPYDLHVSGVTITVEPCSILRVKGPAGFTFDTGGGLVAEGTRTKPIHIIADDATKPWGGMRVFAPSTIRLAYATVEDGGNGTGNTSGAIEVRGDQLLPSQEILFVDHVTVKGSPSHGVSLYGGGAFTKDSTDLTISGAKRAPVRADARLIGNLPTGTYTGNAFDFIQLDTTQNISYEDVTFHERGVPYHVGSPGQTSGDLRVGAGKVFSTLTLEPGVVLKFDKNIAASLHVEVAIGTTPAMGALVAVGTATKHIVFTSQSDAPAAGDWRGLTFGLQPSTKNQLEYVEILYAGGKSGAQGFHCQAPDGKYSANEDAAFALFGPPQAQFLKNSTISFSAGLGIDLGYSGGPVDFLPTNDVNNTADCKQSYPRPTAGSCPTSVACP